MNLRALLAKVNAFVISRSSQSPLSRHSLSDYRPEQRNTPEMRKRSIVVLGFIYSGLLLTVLFVVYSPVQTFVVELIRSASDARAMNQPNVPKKAPISIDKQADNHLRWRENLTTHEREYFEQQDGYNIVLTARADLELQGVLLNRGNCPVLLRPKYPVRLKFGEQIRLVTYCDIIEATVRVDGRDWRFSWN